MRLVTSTKANNDWASAMHISSSDSEIANSPLISALKRLSTVSQLTNYLERSPYFVAIRHGDDTIYPGDTSCSMRHTENRTIPEGLLQGSLDSLIRALVNIRRCLIKHQDARPRQHCPRQSHQLSLTRG